MDRLDYDLEELLHLVGYRPQKNRILLKPNLIAAAPPQNRDDTHPRVTEALIRYFRKRGKEVVLREGGGVFDSDRAFERLLEAPGYLDNLAPVGGRWIARHVTVRKAVSGSDRHCPSMACLLN